MINSLKKNRMLILFLISGLLLCIRSRYGYSFNDEPFIVSLAQRLSYGDALIVDEWNTAQNFGAVLLPLYQLYVAITGSTEGILLAFRLVYSVLWTLTCVAVYMTLSPKFSGAIICYFYLLLFSPLDQMTLSYTSVALMGCILISCLFVYHLEVRAFRFGWFTAAYTALAVIAVLSQPYLAAGYVGLSVYFAVAHLVKKTESSRFFFRVTLVSCLAAAATAGVYVYLFVLSKHTLAEVLLNVENMFTGTKYAGSTVFDSVLSYLQAIVTHYRANLIALAVSVCMICIPSVRRSPRGKLLLFLGNAAVFALVLMKQFLDREQFLFNTQVGPMVFLGIAAYLLLDDKEKYRKLFWIFAAAGVVYSFCGHLASDTGIFAITMGLMIWGVAGIVCIAELYRKQLDEAAASAGGTVWRRTAAIAVAAVFVVQLGFQAFLKIDRHYWDESIIYTRTSVACGAARGIKTTRQRAEEHKVKYSILVDLLENVSREQKEKIRFVSLIPDPVQYLDADLPVGAFSTWTFADSDEKLTERLNRYYSVNPDNVPNVIFYTEGSAILEGLQLNTSDFELFSEREYCLLVHPDLVKSK